MQSGSLSACLAKFFKKTYHFLLRKLTGLKVFVRRGNIDYFRVNFRTSEDFSPKNPAIKELNPIYVLVKEKTIDCHVNINDLGINFKINLPDIRYMTPIDNTIKWIHTDLQPVKVVRNYPLSFEPNFQDLNIDGLLLTAPKTLYFAYDEIRLAEKVRVTEEIITMSPYVKKSERSTLIKVPLIKKPMYKSYFSSEEMDYFRETLASHNKTKKLNVQISNIYDKFNIELFSSIKLEPNSNNLICYLNNKLVSIDKEKIYYLIIGERRDNKVTIKSLARLDEK